MPPPRNLWPLGIIAAFVVFIVGTAGLIVLASSNRMDLVSSDYYEQEIRYQNQIDRVARTQHQATDAKIVYDAARRNITIALPPEHARQPFTGRIHLYRPSAAGLDREIKLEPDSTGLQLLDAAALQRGLWKVRVSWRVGAEDFFLDESVVVTGKGDAI